MMLKALTFLVFFILLSGCATEQNSQSVVEINNGEETFDVVIEVVDTPETRAQGLMFREHLDEDAGMLFVWDSDEYRSFWMKNTLIPLDMIFISSDFAIVDIKEAVPCKSDPCDTYPSIDKAQYVLEVNKGYSKERNIGIGDSVEIMIVD